MATGFGQYPFGHMPFGHPFSASNIIDLAYNPLASPSTGQMIGYIETEAVDETFGLEIYKFIIKEIRNKDVEKGLFLKRYLEGPQQVWNSIQLKALDLKTLWDATAIHEDWLPFLKPIVGWTANLDHITDQLDTDHLRRLVASSVALWKARGNEDSTMDLLTLATGVRMRIWNWFDFRWLSDETVLGEEHEGFDSWVIALPEGDEKEEYWSNLRIVDDGELNRKLIRDIVRLMRGVSERYQITYLAFLDMFEVDGDDSQWYDTYQAATTGAPLSVSDGEASLVDDSVAEAAIVKSDEAQGWDNYVCYWKVKVSQVGGSAGVASLRFYSDDFDNGFIVALDVPNNRFRLGVITAGTPVYTWNASIIPGFVADLYYGVRVVATTIPATGQVNIILYVDNVELINVDTTPAFKGAVGFGHEIDQTITIGEIEVMRLPVAEDLIEINT